MDEQLKWGTAERSIRKAKLLDLLSDHRPDEREALLHEMCGDDPTMIAEVLALFGGSPALIGPYVPVRMLGVGGMGELFLAHHRDEPPDRVVVVKLIRRGLENSAMKMRFERERQNQSRVQHPNVARLLSCGVTADGRPYLVMDYIKGIAITKYCKNLHMREILRLFARLSRVLRNVHEQGVVHGDLKPSNILVGAGGEPYLLDFGVSELISSGPETPGATNLTALSHRYSAPEIRSGARPTKQSDIWSLGLVLYESLSAENGHGDNGNCVPPCGSGYLKPLPQAPKAVNAVIQCALDPEPLKRYPDADCLRIDIENYLSGAALLKETMRESWLEWAQRFAQNNATACALGLAVFGLLLVLGIGGPMIASREHSARQEADRARQTAMKNERIALASNFWRAAQESLQKGNLLHAAEFAIVAGLYGAKPLNTVLLPAVILMPPVRASFAAGAEVTQLVFSPSGDLLLVTTEKGFQLRRAPTFNIVREEQCDVSPKGMFSPDGEQLAISCKFHQVSVFETRTATVLRELPLVDRSNIVYKIQYSPDGQTIAVGSTRGILMFDGRNGRRLSDIQTTPEKTPTQCLIFAADGKWLFAGQTEIGVYAVPSGHLASTLPNYPHAPYGPTETLVAGPKHNWLFSTWGNHRGIVQVTAGGGVESLVRLPIKGLLEKAVFSPDGESLFLVEQGEAREVELRKARSVWRIPAQGIVELSVARTDQSRRVLTLENSGQARIWYPLAGAVAYGEYRRVIQPKPIRSAAISSDGKFVATSDESGATIVSELPVFVAPPADPTRPKHEPSLWLSHSAKWAAQKRAGELQFVETHTLRPVASFRLSDPSLCDVTFSPNDEAVAWTDGPAVLLASTKTWIVSSTFNDSSAAEQMRPLLVRFTHDSNRLVQIAWNGQALSSIELRDTKTGASLKSAYVEGRVTSVAESQPRNELAVAVFSPSTTSLVFYRLSDLQEIRRDEILNKDYHYRIERPFPAGLQYTPNGQYLGLVLKKEEGLLKEYNSLIDPMRQYTGDEEWLQVRHSDSGAIAYEARSQGGILGFVFSPDSWQVRVVSKDLSPSNSTADLAGASTIDIQSQKRVTQEHTRQYRALLSGSLAPDGTIAAGFFFEGDSGLVLLNDGFATLGGDYDEFEPPKFSADGKVLAEVRKDGVLGVRHIDDSALVRAYCSLGIMEMPDQDWNRLTGGLPRVHACSSEQGR
jgi:WD40 repeat protein